MKYKVSEIIDESTSYDLDFDLSDKNGIIEPDSVNVYVCVSGTASPVYINGRNGGDVTGLTIVSNSVSFHMLPDDNAISNIATYGVNGIEPHSVIFECLYNTSTDKIIVQFDLLIRDVGVLT
jgi:hypothetical protein